MKLNPTVAKWAAVAAVPLASMIVKPWEGFSNDPYRDIVNVPTVCYGETRVEMRRYTDAECLAMLNKAVAEFANQVLQCTPRLQYHPYQLAAAVSLAYNIGVGAYCRSTVDRLFDAGDLKGACDQFARWRMAGGVVVQGLVNRRKAEAELCRTGL